MRIFVRGNKSDSSKSSSRMFTLEEDDVEEYPVSASYVSPLEASIVAFMQAQKDKESREQEKQDKITLDISQRSRIGRRRGSYNFSSFNNLQVLDEVPEGEEPLETMPEVHTLEIPQPVKTHTIKDKTSLLSGVSDHCNGDKQFQNGSILTQSLDTPKDGIKTPMSPVEITLSSYLSPDNPPNGNVNFYNKSPCEEDLTTLKVLAQKLNLNTKRPSYTEWLSEYGKKPLLAKCKPNYSGQKDDGKLTDDRKQEIDKALDWLKSELVST